MRILYLPLLVPKGANEQYDLLDAFKKVVGKTNVRTFDYWTFRGNPNTEFIKIAMNFRPGLIHMQLQETDKIQASTVAALRTRLRNCILSQWSGDVRHYAMGNMVQVGRHCDFTMISNTGQIPLYEKEIGKKCYYWQNAIGPRFHVQAAPIEQRWGVAFCGNNYLDQFPNSRQRGELIKALRDTFGDQFRVKGGGWKEVDPEIQPLSWDQQVNFYRTSLVTVSQNHTVTDRYFSDRTLIMMTSGGVPHVMHYSPGVEVDFEHGRDVLYWRTINEAVRAVQWVLDNPESAAKVGMNGYQKIKKNHNWDVRVQEFQKIIGVNLKDGSPIGVK